MLGLWTWNMQCHTACHMNSFVANEPSQFKTDWQTLPGDYLLEITFIENYWNFIISIILL